MSGTLPQESNQESERKVEQPSGTVGGWWSSFTSTVQAAGNFIQTALESESDSDSADNPNGGEDNSKAKNNESESVDKEKAANNENAESNDSESFSWWSYSNFDKFATALKTATDVVKEKSATIASVVKQDLLDLNEQLKTDKKTFQTHADGFVERSKLRLSQLIETDDKTLCRIAQLDLLPTEMEEYEEWKKTFNIQKYTSEILKLLEKNEPIRKYQSEIVPQKMSQDDFWCKYFFHFNLYIKENGGKLPLENNVEDEEEELGWGDDDEEEEMKTETKETAKTKTEVPAKKENQSENVGKHIENNNENTAKVDLEQKKDEEKEDDEENLSWD